MRSLTLSAGFTGTFTSDETIVGATSGARGRVTSYNPTTRVLRYIQTRVEGMTAFTANENITGQGSGVVANVSAVGTPEVQPYSGDIIYFENRRPINRAADQLEDIKLVVEM